MSEVRAITIKEGNEMSSNLNDFQLKKRLQEIVVTVEAHTQMLENLQRQIDALAQAIRNSLLALEIIESKIRKNA